MGRHEALVESASIGLPFPHVDAVVPDYVAPAVLVEISRCHNFIVRRHSNRRCFNTHDSTIHEPVRKFSADVVTPQQVRFAISVDITLANDTPSGGMTSDQDGFKTPARVLPKPYIDFVVPEKVSQVL